MTVVSIIALLMAILIPALSHARVEARRGATRSTLAAIESGLETFHADFDGYPDSSRRRDSVSFGAPSEPDTYLSGAHWLARAMIGIEGMGLDYGARSLTGSPRTYEYPPEFTSSGVYKDMRKPYIEEINWMRDTQIIGMGGPQTGRIVLLDTFDWPILYYRANPRAKAPFCVDGEGTSPPDGTGGDFSGTYTLMDNAEFAGWAQASTTAMQTGWIARDDGQVHGLAEFGYMRDGGQDILQRSATDPRVSGGNPDPNRRGLTFAGYLADDAVTESTAGQRIKPVKDSSFVLISAGPDSLFGTDDDVTNFK